MVSRAGGYNGAPVKGFYGVTQGDSLSPTVFNVVVDSVICHWFNVLVLPDKAALLRGLSQRAPGRMWSVWRHTSMQMTGFLHRCGLLASRRAFDTLTEIFDRVGLRTNVDNTVSME